MLTLQRSRLLSSSSPSALLRQRIHLPPPHFFSQSPRFISSSPISLAPAPATPKQEQALADSPSTIDGPAVLGGEGGHPKDTSVVLKESAKMNEAFDLSRPDQFGPWTLMQPVYTQEELAAVRIAHHPIETISDRIAFGLVKFSRKSFDFFTGYKHRELPHGHEKMTTEELRAMGACMPPHEWLNRILFLETVAGVPGMVGGTLRHLQSLRLMRRDGGWIKTLLEEAENERMHLMTFLQLKKPSLLFRAAVLAAQGVFYNAFFLAYLIHPKAAHRFVGALESEAVITYTRCLQELESGRLPEWSHLEAPQISKDYWRLPEDALLIDVIRAVRADEAGHRFVNNTFSNLNQKTDFSPFAIAEPSAAIRGSQAGFSREEAAEFAMHAREKMMEEIEREAKAKETIDR